jgi:hypothetical protein
MAPVLFRCPNQGIHVTAWRADDAGNGDDTYESVTCTACRQLHFINPKSGKLVIVPFKVADPCIFHLPTRPHESSKQPSREAASVSGLVRRGIVARRSADSVLPPRTEPGGAS